MLAYLFVLHWADISFMFNIENGCQFGNRDTKWSSCTIQNVVEINKTTSQMGIMWQHTAGNKHAEINLKAMKFLLKFQCICICMNATAQRLYQAAHEYHTATKCVYSASHKHGRHRQTVKQTAITILLQSKKRSGNAETFHNYSLVYLALSKDKNNLILQVCITMLSKLCWNKGQKINKESYSRTSNIQMFCSANPMAEIIHILMKMSVMYNLIASNHLQRLKFVEGLA